MARFKQTEKFANDCIEKSATKIAKHEMLTFPQSLARNLS